VHKAKGIKAIEKEKMQKATFLGTWGHATPRRMGKEGASRGGRFVSDPEDMILQACARKGTSLWSEHPIKGRTEEKGWGLGCSRGFAQGDLAMLGGVGKGRVGGKIGFGERQWKSFSVSGEGGASFGQSSGLVIGISRDFPGWGGGGGAR